MSESQYVVKKEVDTRKSLAYLWREAQYIFREPSKMDMPDARNRIRFHGGNYSVNDSIFEIGAPGCDTGKIINEVRTAAAAKKDKGEYGEPPQAGARLKSLALAQNEEGGVNVYRESLRDMVFVDINDFEIVERRTAFASIFIAVKHVLWKLLKFYTYRLWSQQNQINGLLMSSMESAEDNSCARIKELEDRIKALEQKLSACGDIPPGSY